MARAPTTQNLAASRWATPATNANTSQERNTPRTPQPQNIPTTTASLISNPVRSVDDYNQQWQEYLRATPQPTPVRSTLQESAVTPVVGLPPDAQRQHREPPHQTEKHNSPAMKQNRGQGDTEITHRWGAWGQNSTRPRAEAEMVVRHRAIKQAELDANTPSEDRDEQRDENGWVTEDRAEDAQVSRTQRNSGLKEPDNDSWAEPDPNGWVYKKEKREKGRDRSGQSGVDPRGQREGTNKNRLAGDRGENGRGPVNYENEKRTEAPKHTGRSDEQAGNGWPDNEKVIEPKLNQSKNTWVDQELPDLVYRAQAEDPLCYRVSIEADGERRRPYPHELADRIGCGRLIDTASRQNKLTAENLEDNSRIAIAINSTAQHQPDKSRPTHLGSEHQASSTWQGPATSKRGHHNPVPSTSPADQFQADTCRPVGQRSQPPASTGLQEVPAHPAPLSAAQRRQLGRPRPNSQFSVSTRSEISTVVISDAGLGELSSGAGPDIRNVTAPAHDINASDGTWRIHNWGEQDVREVTRSESFLGKFVESWQSAIPGDVIVEFIVLVDQHWHMDVHAETGEPLAPVDYPVTSPHPETLSQELEFRRSNSSSTLQIEKELEARGRRRGGPRPSFRPGITTPGLPAAVRPRTPSPPPGFPRVLCYLRPATEKDLEEVSQIYNLEITGDEGHTMDKNELNSREMALLWQACIESSFPFIVAVQGAPPPLKTSQGSAIHRRLLQGQTTAQSGKILGFGVVSNFMTGVTRSYNAVASKVGRMLVVVHPSFRRQGIGSACMTKLLSCLDPGFASEEKYNFVAPSNNCVYDKATAGATLPCRQLVVEVLTRQSVVAGDHRLADLKRLTWLIKWLVGKFGFEQNSFLANVGDSRESLSGLVYEMTLTLYARRCGAKPEATNGRRSQ